MLKKLIQFSKSRSYFAGLSLATTAVVLSASMTGCTSFRRLGIGEAVAITYRDAVWARRAYNLRYGNCQRPYEEHFRNGFSAGYLDVSNGGDGFVPALPPQDYRGYEFQSADGAKCVDSWFEGYPAGVAAAKKDKSGNYHDVLISRMVNNAISQSKTDPKLPGDVPVVGADEGVRTASAANQMPVRRFGEPLPMNGSEANSTGRSVLESNYSAGYGESTSTQVMPADYRNSEFAIDPEYLGSGYNEPLPANGQR